MIACAAASSAVGARPDRAACVSAELRCVAPRVLLASPRTSHAASACAAWQVARPLRSCVTSSAPPYWTMVGASERRHGRCGQRHHGRCGRRHERCGLRRPKRRSHNRAATTRRTPHPHGRSTDKATHTGAHPPHTHRARQNGLTKPTLGHLSRAAPRAGRRRQTGRAHRSPLWPPPCALRRSRAALRRSTTSVRSTSSRRTPPRSTCCS